MRGTISCSRTALWLSWLAYSWWDAAASFAFPLMLPPPPSRHHRQAFVGNKQQHCLLAFRGAITTSRNGSIGSSSRSSSTTALQDATLSTAAAVVELSTTMVPSWPNHDSQTTMLLSLTSQAISSGVLCGIGDVLAQQYEQQQEEEVGQGHRIDLKRAQRFALAGLGSGVLWSVWYDVADVWADRWTQCCWLQQQPEEAEAASSWMSSMARTLACLGLEQFVGSPLIYGLWSIPVPLLLAGMSFSSAVEQVREKLGGLMVENAKVWTLANVVIYNVPIEWRVLGMSLANVVWQMIVSAALNKDESKSSIVVNGGVVPEYEYDYVAAGDPVYASGAAARENRGKTAMKRLGTAELVSVE